MKLDIYRPGKKPVMLGILLLLVMSLLAACGDEATATGTSGSALGSTSGTVASTSSATSSGSRGTPAASGTRTAGTSTTIAAAVPSVSGQTTKTASGLQITEIKAGDGPTATTGLTAAVNYTGYLTDGKMFDTSVGKGKPFSFVVGSGGAIKGMEEGVVGMKVGGKRRLIIPSDLGYGDGGYPGVIPPKATLIFDIELVSLK